MQRWRLAREHEDEAIVAMCLALNQEDAGQEKIPPEQVRRTLAVLREQPARGRAVVLEVGGHVYGYALLISFWSNELGGEVCVIDEIFVAPHARGHGYGSALIAALVRGEGPWPGEAVALQLEVTPDNRRALDLYRRLGFYGGNLALRLRVVPPSS
jgi:ribosomal protein S18 acetylase RimI-like enzyme